MIDLTRLESFVLAAEAGSFSEAAKHLHLTQPTISHHIKGLEQDFGVSLFDRAGGQAQLTQAGRLLLPLARRLLRQATEVRDIMASCRTEVAGQLRIACSTTAGKYILPLLAARFQQRHPGIRVHILPCTSEHLSEQLLAGEVDVSVTSFELRQAGLQSQPFFEDLTTLVVAAGHRWAGREAIEPEELLEEPLVLIGPSSGTHHELMAELAKHDLSSDDLTIMLELGNAEAIVHTVRSGYGAGFVSTLAAAAELDSGRIVAVPVAGVRPRRMIYMVRRDFGEPNRVQEAFWGFIHHPDNADLLALPQRYAPP